MREIRTSGLMSGEGKRSDAETAQATAPFLDSTPTAARDDPPRTPDRKILDRPGPKNGGRSGARRAAGAQARHFHRCRPRRPAADTPPDLVRVHIELLSQFCHIRAEGGICCASMTNLGVGTD